MPMSVSSNLEPTLLRPQNLWSRFGDCGENVCLLVSNAGAPVIITV